MGRPQAGSAELVRDRGQPVAASAPRSARPVVAPPGEPLDADRVRRLGVPRRAHRRHRADPVRGRRHHTGMVSVDGAPVESVAARRPRGHRPSAWSSTTARRSTPRRRRGRPGRRRSSWCATCGEGTEIASGDAERHAERADHRPHGRTSPASPASPPARPTSSRCPSSCSTRSTRSPTAPSRTATS